jgi:hypothetical protein
VRCWQRGVELPKNPRPEKAATHLEDVLEEAGVERGCGALILNAGGLCRRIFPTTAGMVIERVNEKLGQPVNPASPEVLALVTTAFDLRRTRLVRIRSVARTASAGWS